MAELKRLAPAHTHESKKPKLITEFFALVSKKPDSKRVSTQKSGQKQNITKKAVIEDLNGASEVSEGSKKVENEELDKDQSESSVATEKTDDNADSGLDPSYAEFCAKFNFNKQAWVDSLSTEQRKLLSLEINTMHITWLAALHLELTKPYFLKLKQFLHLQSNKTVFPPPGHIYSWSHFTPLPDVKCLILGQDPYHNFNQAHGLAFLVLEPTRPPPSLLNIYKTLKIDFPSFEIPDYNKLNKQGKPGGGNLTKWAKRGVLMLNACLTVEAHKANSHSGHGWEQFTENVIKAAINYARNEQHQGFVIMAWGSPAQKRVAMFSTQLNSLESPFLVLKTVHPSPLSASRGFFDLKVFAKCNQWLVQQGNDPIDWGITEGNVVTGV